MGTRVDRHAARHGAWRLFAAASVVALVASALPMSWAPSAPGDPGLPPGGDQPPGNEGPGPGGGNVPALPGVPLSIQLSPRPTTIETYPSSLGPVAWRVVSRTGNEAENYLAATPAGRLLNLGGNVIRYTDDAGATWWDVVPKVGFKFPGEGAVAYAPGGDVLGATWGPFDGDRVTSFRFTAATGTWESMEVLLHTPFFDRPWMAVLKGPFTIGGAAVPYLTVLKGGFPSKAVMYYSLDGLHYTLADSVAVRSLPSAISPTLTAVPTVADPDLDWLQPLVEARAAPLGPGMGLVQPHGLALADCVWAVLDPNLTWSCPQLPGGLGGFEGRILVDSEGRLHQVRSLSCDGVACLQYRWSDDGGTTWTSISEPLPGHQIVNVDFKTNAQMATTVVALHLRTPVAGKDRFAVFKYTGPEPALERVYEVGLGDLFFHVGGVTATPRFDFPSIAILNTGKIAVSFGDSKHREPAVAIEL